MKRFTIADLAKTPAAKANPALFQQSGKAGQLKKSKYNNVEVETEDGVFDSKKEAKRAKELRLLLKTGKIAFLARQVDYELNAGGSHSIIYRADFVYVDSETGLTVVEDVKGFRTKVYLKKAKLMKKIHNITIVEI
jgi:hypothetical protein